MWGVFVWILLSAFILGVFAWSTAVLFQQKRAWAAFAKKNNLTYVPGKMFGPPMVTGRIGKNKFTFFTDAQKTGDIRGQRLVTAIEVEMGPGMPGPAAMATKEYRDFVSDLKLPETFVPVGADWNKDYVLQTRIPEKLKEYLTPERQKVLHSIFSMKNSIALFFFDVQEAVLRIETSDPLRDAVHMEKIVRRLSDALDKLRTTDAEQKAWGAAQQPASAPSS